MARDDDKISLTKTELQELIASAVTAAVRAVATTTPAAPESVPFDPDKSMRDQVAAIRGVEVPAPEAIRRVSDKTGMGFTAIIHRGLVVRLVDEAPPAGAERHVGDGDGIVPKGLPLRGKDGQLTPQYKQWFWRELRKPNFENFVGKDVAYLMKHTNAPVDVPAAAE